jgi:hypothetical protein
MLLEPLSFEIKLKPQQCYIVELMLDPHKKSELKFDISNPLVKKEITLNNELLKNHKVTIDSKILISIKVSNDFNNIACPVIVKTHLYQKEDK